MKALRIIFTAFLAFAPFFASAHGEAADGSVVRMRATEVVSQATEKPEGTVEEPFQVWKAKVLSGAHEGEQVEVVNDHLELKPGKTFFAQHVSDEAGDSWQALDVDRLPVLGILAALFVGIILWFGGKQGIRSLLSLGGSFFVLLYLYTPRLVAGWPPVLTSVITATIILVIALYATHGFHRQTHAAFLGTMLTVTLTGLLASAAVRLAALTGFSSDEAVYLNATLEGRLDVRGLLLGGIIIGILGILDDIAVTQASVVAELRSAGKELTSRQVYTHALKVGKEHVGALVNTLALAYAGSALPLLVLFTSERTPALVALNGELVATEVVRTIVGSIGLVLAVPITTFLAVLLVKGEPGISHGHGQVPG